MPISVETARAAILLGFCLVLVVASIWDIRARKIPNWAILSIVGLFLAWRLTLPAISLVSSVGAALIMFACSMALYAFRIVGAGDSKLVTASALFVGLGHLPQFVLYMSLAGGALALFVLASQPTRVLVMLQMRGKARFDRGVPYGVAIAAAGVASLVSTSPGLVALI